MWTLAVVVPNPLLIIRAGMLQALASETVHTLLLEAANYTLDHTVLLRTVWRNELLLQSIAFNRRCKVAARKDQSIF